MFHLRLLRQHIDWERIKKALAGWIPLPRAIPIDRWVPGSKIGSPLRVTAPRSSAELGGLSLAWGELAILWGELEKTIAFNFWLWLIVRVSQNNHVYQPDQTGSFGCQKVSRAGAGFPYVQSGRDDNQLKKVAYA